VIGKLYRMGVPIGRKPSDTAEAPRPRRAQGTGKATARQSRREARSGLQRPRFVEAPVAAAKPALRLVSVGKPIWNAIELTECRWPVSPDDADLHLFCAAPTGDVMQPYCPSCRPLAYSPSKPRIGQHPTAGRRFA
jgi:hypothetical protein